jgi:hypothetical protein
VKFPLFDHFDERTEKHGWEGRSWLERVVIEWLADLVSIKGYEDVKAMLATSASID